MTEIAATALTLAGLARVAALLREVFPAAGHLTDTYLRWDYAENPMGAAIAVDARDGETAVAHLAGRALIARWAGRETQGYLIHHAATRASHRGQRLFGALLDAIASQARTRGAGFLIAVANAKSAPIFVARHGFAGLGALDVELGAGLPPRPRETSECDFEPVWSREAIAWRLARPGAAYRARRVGDSLQCAAPTGLLGAWVELAWVRGDAIETAPQAFAREPWLGARIGIGSGRRSGRWAALPVPRRLRPSPLELVFLDLAGARAPERSRTSFGVLDFDAF